MTQVPLFLVRRMRESQRLVTRRGEVWLGELDQPSSGEVSMRCQPRLWAALVAVSSCTRTVEPCQSVPCPTPGTAIEITLTGSPAGTPLTTASYRVLATGSLTPCNRGPSANVCVIDGGPGTYQLEISAMFYETVHRTVVVAAKSAARCSCPESVTQQLTIAMSPTS